MGNIISKVIIITATEEVGQSLRRFLNEADAYDAHIAIGSANGIQRTKTEEFHLIIVDLDWHRKGMGRPDATEALRIIGELSGLQPHVPIIAMTTIPDATATIDAMKAKADRCIQKPTNEEQLKEFQLELRKAIDRPDRKGTASPITAVYAANGIVGCSRAMREVSVTIGRLIGTDETILITGETGVGKELFARLIHDKSDRSDKPFIIVDCAALSETLAESELFGHAKGAFTGATTERKGKFEEADGGTIFLDEIGELSPPLQKKLLRVLERKTVQPVGSNKTISLDVRVVAATNRNLKQAVKEKEFRKDLYHRLGSPVVLPPLRERREDIPNLVRYFMEEDGPASCHADCRISLEALEFLQEQSWPGNIRQLKNVIHDALSRSNGFGITLDIVREVFRAIDDTEQKTSFEEALTPHINELLTQAREGTLPNCYEVLVENMERVLFKRAYDEAGQKIPATARLLGLSYPCTQKRLEHYGLLIEKKGSKKPPTPDVLKNGSNEMFNGHFKEVPEGHLNEVLKGHFETSPAF